MDRSWLFAVSLMLASLSTFGLWACDTSAVGVDSCRQIEYARCSAASHCPSTFKVTSPAACRRFYRDHCLHGLAIPTDPGPALVNPCVNAIDAIRTCLVHDGESATVQSCRQNPDLDLGKYSKKTTLCALLGDLENINGCTFLNPVTPVVISDAGNDSGS